MAQKSKSQRAKKSAARRARKERREEEAVLAESGEDTKDQAKEAESKGFFKSRKKDEDKKENKVVVEPTKNKKKRFTFIKEVRAELKRVTWPSRQDVFRWSLVVVGALLFFGIFTAVLDNVIIAPLMVALSGLGA